MSAAGAYNINNAYRLLGGVIATDDRSTFNRDGTGYWLGGDYRVGANTFKMQYVESKLKRDTLGNDGKTQAIGVGYQYDLSKRTALYSSLTHFKNDGVGYAPSMAGGMPAGLTSSADGNVNEFVTGIRHSF